MAGNSREPRRPRPGCNPRYFFCPRRIRDTRSSPACSREHAIDAIVIFRPTEAHVTVPSDFRPSRSSRRRPSARCGCFNCARLAVYEPAREQKSRVPLPPCFRPEYEVLRAVCSPATRRPPAFPPRPIIRAQFADWARSQGREATTACALYQHKTLRLAHADEPTASNNYGRTLSRRNHPPEYPQRPPREKSPRGYGDGHARSATWPLMGVGGQRGAGWAVLRRGPRTGEVLQHRLLKLGSQP